MISTPAAPGLQYDRGRVRDAWQPCVVFACDCRSFPRGLYGYAGGNQLDTEYDVASGKRETRWMQRRPATVGAETPKLKQTDAASSARVEESLWRSWTSNFNSHSRSVFRAALFLFPGWPWRQASQGCAPSDRVVIPSLPGMPLRSRHGWDAKMRRDPRHSRAAIHWHGFLP